MDSSGTATTEPAPKGLEGVVVAETTIGDVLGHEGFFHYRGHPAPELALERTFEEVWHLIHHGHLPDPGELAAFRARTAAMRSLPGPLREALVPIAHAGTPMAALRTGLSLAGAESRSWLDLSPAEREEEVLRLSALAPSIVAAIWRARQGLEPLPPEPSAGVAEDYLRTVTGSTPSAEQVRALERYLILTIDHGFNTSTFATRVVTSSGGDVASALVAGVGALSGPLHGGAPGRVLEMLQQIGSPEQARPWVERTLAGGGRIMGFGHRIYRTEDPRSVVLKRTAQEIGGPLVDLAVEVERTVLEVLDARYPERDLRTNVEFYAGVVLHLIGLPGELFSPTFATSRIIGWAAHALEQMEGNRIIRPASRFVSP